MAVQKNKQSERFEAKVKRKMNEKQNGSMLEVCISIILITVKDFGDRIIVAGRLASSVDASFIRV